MAGRADDRAGDRPPADPALETDAGPVLDRARARGVLALALIYLAPRHVEGNSQARRKTSLALIGLVTAANIYALARLSEQLLHNKLNNGPALIGAGVLIWLTNFLIFGLWYWELDRGGPGLRAAGDDRAPDLLFVQMNDDRIQPPDWRPGFIDYLYVSLTNATAFSPTDTMPLDADRQVDDGRPIAGLACHARTDRGPLDQHPLAHAPRAAPVRGRCRRDGGPART